ncbi:MAG: CDP-alcohol phosphatidyltransferase family protein [Armatimonadetes bacterium]|nr:CDP-alcohol phosphatidyltransferase family protein [Armatimonadota bacterium]
MSDSVATPQGIRGMIVTGVTGLNLILGLAALLATTIGWSSIGAWCLLACVMLDFADGALARHWKVCSDFGAQLDSLADMTSFCIASSVLTFYWFSPEAPLPWIIAASALYVLSGAIRLARFNTGIKLEDEFKGMPTTAVAALVALTYLTFPQLNCWWGIALVVLLSFLMVSVFPYPKFCRMMRYPASFWGILAVGAMIDLSWTIWLSAVAYIASGPLRWLRFKLRARSAARKNPDRARCPDLVGPTFGGCP